MSARSLAALLVCALASSARAGQPLPALPASALPAPGPAALYWDDSATYPEPGHAVVCERKPVVAQAALPDPRANFSSPLTFQAAGVTVHVAGSKDRRQKYGYFLAFTAEGDAPVWVKMGLGKKSFQLRGRPYSVETHLSLLHHERIELVVRDESTGAGLTRFSVGELAQRVQSAGPALWFGGREYRLTYVEDIREENGWPEILPDQHTALLTTYDTYTYDGGRTGYKFQQIPLQAEPLRGSSIQPRRIGGAVYGFHVTARNVLQVYDLTDYARTGAPACPPLD
jgi:hypothetical protein